MSFLNSTAPGRRLRGAFAIALLAAFSLAAATPAEAQFPHKRHDRPHVQRPRPHVAPAPRVRRPPPVVRHAPRPYAHQAPRPYVHQAPRPFVNAPRPYIRHASPPAVRFAPRPVYREPERRHYVQPDIYAHPIVAVAPPYYRRHDPWAGCASEPRVCRIPYPTYVRYGARGRYVQLWVEGSVRCDNHTFGDPIRGVRKSCAYRIR